MSGGGERCVMTPGIKRMEMWSVGCWDTRELQRCIRLDASGGVGKDHHTRTIVTIYSFPWKLNYDHVIGYVSVAIIARLDDKRCSSILTVAGAVSVLSLYSEADVLSTKYLSQLLLSCLTSPACSNFSCAP